MSHPEANRARFFSRNQDSNASINVVSGSEKSSTALVAVSKNAAATHTMITGALNRTNSNDDDIIAQRTRMIETETLFKPKKDRNGKLNLSGLIKENNKKPRDNLALLQSATITEIVDKNSEISQNSNSNTLTDADTNSLAVKPRLLNAQAAAFIPSSLNVRKASDLTTETPINQTSFNNNQLSRGDRLISNEALMLSGNQHSPFQASSDSSTTMRAIGSRNSLLETINRPTAATEDEQYTLATSYDDDTENIRSPRFLTDTNDINGKRVQSVEKRKSDAAGEVQVPNYAVIKKRKNNNGVALDHAYESNNIQQPSSPPESYVSRSGSADERVGAVASTIHTPSSSSFATALGRDIENYIASHLDEYERAKARWTDCSREEWEQGAVEIAGQFTKILDFVKDHMKRKIMLYANLQAKLDDHRSVRDGIASMLKEAKNELVTKTGVLIEEGKSN